MAGSQYVDVASNDWTDLGSGPIEVYVRSDNGVMLSLSATKPTSDSGRVIKGGASDTVSSTSRVWARALRGTATISYETTAVGASQTAPVDSRGTFTLDLTKTSGAGSFVDMPLNGQGIVALNFSGLGGSGAVVTYYSSNKDGATPASPISSVNAATGTTSPNRTTDGETRIPVAGRSMLRLQVTTAGTGTLQGAYSIVGTAVSGLVDIGGPVPSGVDEVDRSGTTSASVNTFGTGTISALSTRQFLRVQNLHASGNLFVYSKTAGTPTVNNSLKLPPGQAFVWDTKVPKGAIQFAGSVASMPFEAAEG